MANDDLKIEKPKQSLRERTLRTNLSNYVNSDGTMGKLPEGWTLEKAKKYLNTQ